MSKLDWPIVILGIIGFIVLLVTWAQRGPKDKLRGSPPTIKRIWW